MKQIVLIIALTIISVSCRINRQNEIIREYIEDTCKNHISGCQANMFYVNLVLDTVRIINPDYYDSIEPCISSINISVKRFNDLVYNIKENNELKSRFDVITLEYYSTIQMFKGCVPLWWKNQYKLMSSKYEPKKYEEEYLELLVNIMEADIIINNYNILNAYGYKEFRGVVDKYGFIDNRNMKQALKSYQFK